MSAKNIQEDSERGVVIIGGVQIIGSVDEHWRCECGSARIYHDDFDAHFCPDCNRWLESVCSDESCEYCRRRPAHPLPAAS